MAEGVPASTKLSDSLFDKVAHIRATKDSDPPDQPISAIRADAKIHTITGAATLHRPGCLCMLSPKTNPTVTAAATKGSVSTNAPKTRAMIDLTRGSMLDSPSGLVILATPPPSMNDVTASAMQTKRMPR